MSAASLAINPNAKAAALLDREAVVFDCNAILLYPAEKTAGFLPAGGQTASAELEARRNKFPHDLTNSA